MLDSITKPDVPAHSLEREWGASLFEERKADHIRRRPPTWRHRVGVALGSFAMLTFAAQPVFELQIERVDRERAEAKFGLLISFSLGKDEVASSLPKLQALSASSTKQLEAITRGFKGVISHRAARGELSISWEDLRLLSTPTSHTNLETIIAGLYESLAGHFAAISIEQNRPLPVDFSFGAAGYMLCGTGPGGSHSSNGCHACVASNNGDSERNRRYLARLFRRLARKSPDARLRVFAKGAGEGDMDVFAAAWFAKWPEAPRQLLLKETSDLSDAAKSIGISFDTKEHLMNRVIEIAINQIATRKQANEAAIPFVPVLPIVIQQSASSPIPQILG